MRKGINLKERHRHSGKGCELYFVQELNHRQFRQLLLQTVVCMEICFISAMYVGLVEVKCYEECTY